MFLELLVFEKLYIMGVVIYFINLIRRSSIFFYLLGFLGGGWIGWCVVVLGVLVVCN